MLEDFLVGDLSKTYIKIIRDRAGETTETLNQIRIDLLKLLAPIIPFTTEEIWQNLINQKIVSDKQESIHLTDWPKLDKKKIDLELEKQFDLVLQIIEKGLAERDSEKLGLKWPLAKATIGCNSELEKDLQEIVARQLNVRKVELKKSKEISVKLDTKMTKELEAEGFAREISRKIQSERKNAGLVKTDKIDLEISGEVAKIVTLQEDLIKERVNARNLEFKESDKTFKHSSDGKIKDKEFSIKFKKV